MSEYNTPNNPYLKNTFAILMPVFNEYSYINFFIEYHKNLGFDNFYILIDDSTDIQSDYKIKEWLIPYVKFYRLTNIYSQSQINDIIKNSNHKSTLVHSCLQHIFLDIVEDYVITLGIDSFLYLNGINIRDFLFKNNIGYDISQIFFNWVQIFNKNINSQYNILNELNNENYNYVCSNHYFTLCQKKYVYNLDITSHFYRCKNDLNNICWCNNKIFEITNNTNFYDIVNLKQNNIRFDFGCIIHFIFRNIKDIFIKSYYSWNNDKNKTAIMFNEIINNKTNKNEIIGTGFRLDYLDQLKNLDKKIDLKFDFKYKDIDCDSNLFMKMLNDVNISEENFMAWANKYLNIK